MAINKATYSSDEVRIAELETQLEEEKRVSESVSNQIRAVEARCKGLEEENEQLKVDLETKKFVGVNDHDIQILRQEKQQLLERLKSANSKAGLVETLQAQLTMIQTQKDEVMEQLRSLHSSKSVIEKELSIVKAELL